ncbi:uncharacterized protein LOC126355083 isoform X1 [Schistocerca gregaria]|uniref:uncharacterized protein LOC126355083 isoform X1 n=1 Tax=Schistocerca gregaria TaxID=7010 RepID=UPI00211EF3BF|nr:uncharacterized protein LOC126355083 isoform X1 [Schistocerca gregaria]
MAVWRLAPLLSICALAFVSASLASPNQLLQVFIDLVVAASGSPRSNGTGCSPPYHRHHEAEKTEYLQMLKALSKVAKVVDHEGRRLEEPLEDDAGSGSEATATTRHSKSFINRIPSFKKCPPGQQIDRIGKCRKVISDSKVWAT